MGAVSQKCLIQGDKFSFVQGGCEIKVIFNIEWGQFLDDGSKKSAIFVWESKVLAFFL